MGYDEKLADRVRRILSGQMDVVENKMFGGLCFMVNGSMCCGLTSRAFMVRVGREGYADALALPHARPMDFTGRPMAGMVYVDANGLKTEAALAKWVQRGIEFVSALPSKKAAPKSRRKRSARGPAKGR